MERTHAWTNKIKTKVQAQSNGSLAAALSQTMAERNCKMTSTNLVTYTKSKKFCYILENIDLRYILSIRIDLFWNFIVLNKWKLITAMHDFKTEIYQELRFLKETETH